MIHSSSTSAVSKSRINVFVIAKNEESNIGKCLDSLENLQLPVNLLLDNSSTDYTALIASKYSFVDVVKYDYVSHCVAYNQICASRDYGSKFSMILDADMVVTAALLAEIVQLSAQSGAEVIRAPVLMCAEGHPIRHGSLYPPKAIAFKVGREYFVPVGHGEELMDNCSVKQTKSKLIHDDRKAYSDYLSTQYRYSEALRVRGRNDVLTWRDKLRVNTPIMIVITPFVSYFIKLGFLSGKAALVYALDRLIAEAVMFRQSLAKQLEKRDKR